MVMYPVYLHYLGYAQYGIWLALSTVIVFAQLGELGIGTTVSKLVAEYHEQDRQRELIPAVFMSAIVVMAVIGLAIMLLILAFRPTILNLFAFDDAHIALAAEFLCYIAPLSMLAILVQPFLAVLEGLGRMDYAHYIRTISKFAGFTIAAVLLSAGLGLYSLIAGNVFSLVFTALSSMLLYKRIGGVPLLCIGSINRDVTKRMLHFGGGVTAGRVVAMFLDPFNRIMLTRFAGVDLLPVYDIAFRSCQTLRSFANTGLRALVPEASRLHAINTVDSRLALRKIFSYSSGLLLAASIAVGLPIALAARPLFNLWLRQHVHPDQSITFRIILAGCLLSMISTPAYNIALGMGRIRFVFLSHFITAVVNITVLTFFVLAQSGVSLEAVSWSVCASWTAAALFLLATMRSATYITSHDHLSRRAGA